MYSIEQILAALLPVALLVIIVVLLVTVP